MAKLWHPGTESERLTSHGVPSHSPAAALRRAPWVAGHFSSSPVYAGALADRRHQIVTLRHQNPPHSNYLLAPMRHLALPAVTASLLAAAGVHAAPAPAPAVESSVVVTGQRASLARAIAAQEQADNIVSVVSSDDIGHLPDKNAAEALARVPGLSVQRDQGEGRYVVVRGLDADYNSVTINGALVPSPEATRRAVALDVLPAGLVRSLEVTKSATPDQDANSLGGTVEVKTLSAFDLPGKLLSVGVAASHDTNTDQNSPSANLLWAQRFMDGKLGIAAGLSGEKRKFGSDNVETGGAWDGNRLEGFEMRDYLPTRERRAGAVNLDYRPDASTSYALRGFLSRFSDDESRDRMTVGDFENDDESVVEGELAPATVERRLRQRKYTQEIRSLTGSMDRRFGDAWKMRLEAATSRATDETPNAISDARFTNVESFEGVGFANARAPHLIAPAGVLDAANYELDSFAIERAYAKDTSHQLRLDLQREFDAGDWSGALKFGAKATRRDKRTDTDAWEFGSDDPEDGDYWGAGPTSMSAFVNGTRIDYPFGNLGYTLDPNLVRARLAGLNREGARAIVDSALDDFKLQEDIDAAYVQASLRSGAWSLLAGVRAERTRFKADGSQVTDEEEITPRGAARSYTNWLPGVHLRYDLDQHTSLRAAWSNSVVRANFAQLAPGVSLDGDDEATIGNPDLNPLRSHNLDLGIERTIGGDGVVSAYVFTKDIKDFTYATDLAGRGDWVGFNSAISYANGEQARVRGIELAWQQPLRMLPAPFNGLLIGINGAITHSRADIDSADGDGGVASRSIRMPGQSNRIGNLMVGYESGPFSARLAMNYKSPYLLELGEDVLDASQDRYVDTQKQLDFSMSFKLDKRWQLTFDASNLNNEKYYVYMGDKSRNAQHEQYGRTFKIGLKASIF
ncbi:TonB-dependent receptor family protein [Massilia timonae]|uniref:TonB-dependent receptor family protein n=2 Tax=Massilia timonae TaxID=47229 RepID=A0A1S2NIZ5_9BURK|nr:TonB-dependent receptor family protein [Massilia timonae]